MCNVSELYRTDMGRLLRYVCENPHIAASVLYLIELFDPEEILSELTFKASLAAGSGSEF